MFENLAHIEERYKELTQAMATPEVATDYMKLAEYGQERAELEPIVLRYREYEDVLQQIEVRPHASGGPPSATMGDVHRPTCVCHAP